MKKIYLLATLLLMLMPLNMKAQQLKLGVHAGVNTSGFCGGDAYKVYDRSNKIGFEVGGDVDYTLRNGLLFHSGLSLLQTGGSFSVMSSYVGTNGQLQTEFPEVNAKLISFEIPLQIGYEISLSDGFSITPKAGVYGRFAIASPKGDVRAASEKTSTKWDCLEDYNNGSYHLDALNRWDAGVIAGVEATLFKHYTISASYKRGMTDLSSQYGYKSQSFSLNVGYKW